MTDKAFKRKLEKTKKQCERYKQEQELIDTYAKYLPRNKEKKKKKISNIMLVVVVIAIVGYVIADYALQSQIGVEISPTITPYWFGFWGSELFLLAGIKTTKVIKGSSESTDSEINSSED